MLSLITRHKFKKQSKSAGLPPGSMVFVGNKKAEDIRVTLFDYDAEKYTEKKVENLAALGKYVVTPSITWVNLDGLHDPEAIKHIGDQFSLHPLLLEDILNTTQRPKVEHFDNYTYFTLKMLSLDEKTRRIVFEQVSFVFGENFVLSFQEVQGDVFETIRDRIRNAKGKVRLKRSDYLVYLLMDAVIDNYFIILDNITERIELLEEKIFEKPDDHVPLLIQELKREMIFIKKNVIPLREGISSLEKSNLEYIYQENEPYFRDLFDHILHIQEAIDTYREMISSLRDTYLTQISNRMNEIMKVLTIMATIFIPLTFIAGIYGMNFEYMPELGVKWGYFGVWGIMLIVGLGMVLYFKKKKWL